MSTASRLLIVLITVVHVSRIQGTFGPRSWKDVTKIGFTVSGNQIEFPSSCTGDVCRDNGKFVPDNVIITRAQVYRYDAVFAMPRYKSNVPVTLGISELCCKGGEPKIKPFPDWSMQEEDNCDALQSVVDIYLDRKDQLWVLDEGEIDYLGEPHRRCPPKVVCISMIDKKVINTIDLLPHVDDKSNLQYIVSETASNGKTYVYISDASGSIIVVDTNTKEGRVLTLPSSVTETCGKKCAFYLTIMLRGDLKNYLYFTYIDCPKVYALPTTALHKNGGLEDIQVIGPAPEGSGIVFLGTDNFSRLFFRHRDANDVFMWDSNTPWREQNWRLVEKGAADKQITHVLPGFWKLLWVLENDVRSFTEDGKGVTSRLYPFGKDYVDGALCCLRNQITGGLAGRRNALV